MRNTILAAHASWSVLYSSTEDKLQCADEDSETPERKPEEVIADLETMLAVTAEELEQQKKLNQSLLKRKVCHPCKESLLGVCDLVQYHYRISRKLNLLHQCNVHDMCATDIETKSAENNIIMACYNRYYRYLIVSNAERHFVSVYVPG